MLTYVAGDPLLTQAQTLAFSHNARGRAEVDPLHTALLDRYPAAFASFTKLCRHERIKPGEFWIWRDSSPYLMFVVARETAVGMTRARFVESAVLTLARDYRLHGLTSLAVAPFGTALEWPLLKQILDKWFTRLPLPVTVYEQYQPGVVAEVD